MHTSIIDLPWLVQDSQALPHFSLLSYLHLVPPKTGKALKGPFLPRVGHVCSLATITVKVWCSLGLLVMQKSRPSVGQDLPFIT